MNLMLVTAIILIVVGSEVVLGMFWIMTGGLGEDAWFKFKIMILIYVATIILFFCVLGFVYGWESLLIPI